jgi:hypothetical protein
LEGYAYHQGRGQVLKIEHGLFEMDPKANSLLGYFNHALDTGFSESLGVVEAKCEEIDGSHLRRISILILHIKRA